MIDWNRARVETHKEVIKMFHELYYDIGVKNISKLKNRVDYFVGKTLTVMERKIKEQEKERS